MIKLTIPVDDLSNVAGKAKKAVSNKVAIKHAPLSLLPLLGDFGKKISDAKEVLKDSKKQPLIIQVFNQDIEIRVDHNDNFVIKLLD